MASFCSFPEDTTSFQSWDENEIESSYFFSMLAKFIDIQYLDIVLYKIMDESELAEENEQLTKQELQMTNKCTENFQVSRDWGNPN